MFLWRHRHHRTIDFHVVADERHTNKRKRFLFTQFRSSTKTDLSSHRRAEAIQINQKSIFLSSVRHRFIFHLLSVVLVVSSFLKHRQKTEATNASIKQFTIFNFISLFSASVDHSIVVFVFIRCSIKMIVFVSIFASLLQPLICIWCAEQCWAARGESIFLLLSLARFSVVFFHSLDLTENGNNVAPCRSLHNEPIEITFRWRCQKTTMMMTKKQKKKKIRHRQWHFHCCHNLCNSPFVSASAVA